MKKLSLLSMVELSIIIVSFNTKDLTINCLKSILDSGCILPYEIIVVDNGSLDGSVKAIKKFIQSEKDSRNIYLIRNRSNIGFARANNQGIKKAKGKYILLLNSDTKVVPSSLDKLVKYADKKKDAGVVGARLLNSDKSIQSSVYRLPTITRAIKQYWFAKEGLLDKYYPKSGKPTEVEAVVGAVFLITPQARTKVGRLNNRYFMYYEDLDYCRRVLKSGLKVYYLPSAKIIHYHGASGKNVFEESGQWRRLIPSSKVYHGIFGHYLFFFIIWISQKFQKALGRN
jgi:GT2 family glycosyltransferase